VSTFLYLFHDRAALKFLWRRHYVCGFEHKTLIVLRNRTTRRSSYKEFIALPPIMPIPIRRKHVFTGVPASVCVAIYYAKLTRRKDFTTLVILPFLSCFLTVLAPLSDQLLCAKPGVSYLDRADHVRSEGRPTNNVNGARGSRAKRTRETTFPIVLRNRERIGRPVGSSRVGGILVAVQRNS